MRPFIKLHGACDDLIEARGLGSSGTEYVAELCITGGEHIIDIGDVLRVMLHYNEAPTPGCWSVDVCQTIEGVDVPWDVEVEFEGYTAILTVYADPDEVDIEGVRWE